ncbi:membrane protein insertase YidC [Persicimonas caeni]|uniref:Membrane protein insertase YidC n=1 Tax=Persicimonas caeni TaxID=2292766 RepID=A0A4Y6PT24_PERCE|nr:membrane protein insertase YidC [Persicimonas caeni]QDG51484.1 membrane protein insertase YidC [Persicimonas caeni]QED32705.1 membrane protein insertase YidC [Persicimonas caeni]
MEQKRFILAMVLSAAVLLIWQTFVAPPMPEEDAANGEQTVEQTADGEEAADEAQGADKQADAAEGADQQAAQQDARAEGGADDAQAEAQEPTPQPRNVAVRKDIIKSDMFTVHLTNDQARVTSVQLTEPEQYQAKGDLVGFPKEAKHYPFELDFLEQSVDFPSKPVYELVEDESVKGEGEAYDKIVYRYVDPQGRFQIDKVFSLDRDLPYVVDMDVQITNLLDKGRLVDTVALDIFEWKDPNKESSFLDFQPNEVEGVCMNSEDIERESFDSVLDSPQRFDEGETLWGAVDTRYFMMAAIPDKPVERCELKVVDSDYIRTRLVNSGFSIEPGQTETLSHKLFMGPKDVDVLNGIDDSLDGTVSLEESVDYGMFAFIARPMRWGLEKIYNFVGNWGLAIIILTFLIRGALWPINMKAYSSMERMKKVQPLLTEVKEKYEDDRQRMTEETMKIFREHNVSPAGGCLPMIMQMPILYGLYVMIYNSVELYHADFALWYTNLAEPDPYYVLPVLMGIVMFAQQKMSTVDTTNQQAMMMMKIMPFMFAGFMIFLPSGLVLYYALSLLIGVGQQFYVKKKYSGEEIEAAKA